MLVSREEQRTLRVQLMSTQSRVCLEVIMNQRLIYYKLVDSQGYYWVTKLTSYIIICLILIQPILMAPIQVVELANIPPELQVDSRIQSTTNSTRPSSHYPPISALHYQGYRRIRPGVGDDIMPWLVRM